MLKVRQRIVLASLELRYANVCRRIGKVIQKRHALEAKLAPVNLELQRLEALARQLDNQAHELEKRLSANYKNVSDD
jgi:uncharacterized protein (DUF3084 family)